MRASGVDPADLLDMHASWLTVLLWLEAYVDLGVDLRNHDSTRTWGRRYVDQRRVATADRERSGGDVVDLIAAPGESRDDLSEGAEARDLGLGRIG